jgi:small redox-active disulfide protein 2
MEIRVLGTGCHNCLRLELLVGQVLEELGVKVDLSRIDDPREINRYVLAGPPGLVIDGVLAAEGRVPDKEEIRSWIAAALDRA